MEGNEKIRKYVVAMMQSQNISWVELSKRAKVHKSCVYKFLKGEKNISLNGADKILAVFGLEIKVGRQNNRNAQ